MLASRMTTASTNRASPVAATVGPSTRGAFFREFLRSPARTAAVAPSSRALSQEMIRGVDLNAAKRIVEFGPGSGAFTRATLGALPPAFFDAAGPTGGAGGAGGGSTGRFIAIEFNANLAKVVQAAFPTVEVVTGSAEDIEPICRDRGIGAGSVDLVISGLGWVSFPKPWITKTLEATHRMLRPGGEFRTFGYHCGLLYPGAWHFRREIKRLFGRTSISRVVWGNIPPAFVYRAVK